MVLVERTWDVRPMRRDTVAGLELTSSRASPRLPGWRENDCSMSRTLTLDELKSMVGQELPASEPVHVAQERVNLFADATDDHQWIHVDPERARRGPFGGPIAHGYLTLSLLPHLMASAFRVGDVKMGVNYGLNRLRFPAPVPVGSDVRAKFTLNGVKEIEGGVQVLVGFEVGVDGGGKPSAVGEAVFNYYV
jgi:acyl dehydratase